MQKLSPFMTNITLRAGLFLALMLGGISILWGQTTLARFQLNGNLTVSSDNAIGTPSATNNSLTFSTNNVCEGSGHLYGDANTDYIDIFINTSGFRNITLSWQQRLFTSSGTGTNIWNLYGDYNNDGSNDYSVNNNAAPTSSCATITLTMPATFDNQGNVKLRIQRSGTGSRTIYLDDIYIRGYIIPQYLAQFTSMNTGSINWCAGETRTVSVTVKNIGLATWTNSGPDINIGVKWIGDGDYLVRTDANDLAPGATRTYSLTVTAPAAGSNNLTFDVVKEGDCWFGNNNGSCGPGNTVLVSSALTINANPSPAPASAGTSVCSGKTASLTTSGAGASEGYKWYDQYNGGNLVFTGISFLTPELTANTTWHVCKYNTSTSCESSRTAVTVAVNSLPTFTTTYTDITCFGAGDGKITITIDNASGIYQYSINNGSPYTYNGTSPKTIPGLGIGEYKIRVKDASGCESTDCP